MAHIHVQAESSRTAAVRALSQFDTQALEDEIARRMAQLSNRQLEQELERRRTQRVRTRRTGVTRTKEPRPGYHSATPIDLTEDEVELNAVMKIDNEGENDLDADVTNEGELEGDVNAAARFAWDGNLEARDAKVENESEAGDDSYVANGNNGENDIMVKIEGESEAEDDGELHIEDDSGGDDGNRFWAKVENENEAENEVDGENGFGNHFMPPVDDDMDTAMDDDGERDTQHDAANAAEDNMDMNTGDEFEASIDNHVDNDSNDGMENNIGDEVTNETSDGMDSSPEETVDETNDDRQSDMQDNTQNSFGNIEDDVEDDFLENSSEDGVRDNIDDGMKGDTELDRQGITIGRGKASSSKNAGSRGRRRLPLHQKKAPPPAVYKAKVHSLAELGTIRVNSSTADIDHSMMEKIKNCLLRGQHPGTQEAEAKRALLHAKVLMKRYNVSRAEVLAHEPVSTQKQYAGQSSVFLRRADGDTSKSVRQDCFVDYLIWAMNIFFDCKAYDTKYTKHRPGGRDYAYSVEFTFYGIAENTIAAAMGFEMAYNLISEWSRSHKGKHCYCLGASKQLYNMANAEKAEEEALAKKAESDAVAARVAQEAAEERARLARLAPLPDPDDKPNPPKLPNGEHVTLNVDSGHESSSDDEEAETDDDDEDNDDDGDVGADFVFEDDEMEDVAGGSREESSMMNQAESLIFNTLSGFGGVSRTASPSSPRSTPAADFAVPDTASTGPSFSEATDPEAGSGRTWASHMQLTVFCANAMNIAEEYLKDQGTKLGKEKYSRSDRIKDEKAYQRGLTDGKKIDVHQRRIKESQVAEHMMG